MVLRAAEALKKYKKTLLLMEVAARAGNREWYGKLYRTRDKLWIQTTVSNNFLNGPRYNCLVSYHSKLVSIWIERT